ncbi:type 4 (IV) prepilin-like protein leader peptide processing enzyme PilD [Legionella birminghamensis]|uniref:Prepilin leader peptidase/N-methyltransferase n=1 Tax=Legionella birminghamensis TaxID=28083 RepID=A0A378I8Z2_9GAMM|nr:A24 family peptidase [Legionella birminghamensis]KTC69346.1 type 4 (IV) prepilin-like protein leader peptide processing enzyme PilD [Legionella birminghamensis]STX31609.1 type 4 (IV) prepilin-like protein leader peptide processing enzyme PilD [Legionella birminghamensis]
MFNQLAQLPPFVLYVFMALFTLSVGSVLNMIIYRLPIMLRQQWTEECECLLNIEASKQDTKINLFLPRSFCPSCKKTVPAIANIPLFSYFFLRGKCKFCKQPIPFKYPLVEFLTCIISLYATWVFGFNWFLPLILLFLWILITMIYIDLEHQILPDNLTLSLLWLGLLANTQHLFADLPNAVFSAAGAYLFLWMIMKLFYLATGKIGMGNGDFKLFAALGAWFGWIMLPLILLVASFSGALVGIIYLRMHDKSRDTPIPFGPFLCLAAMVVLFWGKTIIHWYLGFWF